MFGYVFFYRDDIWVIKIIFCIWYIIKIIGRKIKIIKDGIYMFDFNLIFSKFWRYLLLGYYVVRGNNKWDICWFLVWFFCGSEI